MTLTVAYTETEVRRGQSPQFSCDPDGAQAVRFLQFAWGDMEQAEYEIMGYSTRIAAGTFGLSRNLPECHPDRPWLWASRVSFVEGRGARGFDSVSVPIGSGSYPVKTAKYSLGVLRVDYGWRSYDVLLDSELSASEYERFVAIEEHGACDYLTPPPLRFKLQWAEGPNQHRVANATFGKLVPFANTVMTWTQIPYAYIPRTTIRDSYGKVSNAALTDPTDPQKTYDAGTLLFLGCRRRRYAMAYQGTPAVDLQYQFRHDQEGPNTFPDFLANPIVRRLISVDGNFHAIGSRTGKTVYEEFDPRELYKVI